MGRVHINDRGEAKPCNASTRNCVYGDHFDSMAEGEAEVRRRGEEAHGLIPSHSKKNRVVGESTMGETEHALVKGANTLRMQQSEMMSQISSSKDLIKAHILQNGPDDGNFFTAKSREAARGAVYSQVVDLGWVESQLATQKPLSQIRGNSLDEETLRRYANMSSQGRYELRRALDIATRAPGFSHLHKQKSLGEIMEQVEQANRDAMSKTPMGRWMAKASYSDLKDACYDMLAQGTIDKDELETLNGDQLLHRLEQHHGIAQSVPSKPRPAPNQPMKRSIPPVKNPSTYSAEEFVDALESEREKPIVKTEQRRAPGIAGALGVLNAVRVETPNERVIALSEFRRTLPMKQQDLINTMMEAKSIGASQQVIDQINNAYKHEQAMGYNRAWDEALQEQRDRDNLILSSMRERDLVSQEVESAPPALETPKESPQYGK